MNTDLLTPNYIGVFTDGSSLIGKDKSFYEASSGYLITINGEEVFKCNFYHNNGTNSIGEVYAMCAAIEKVEEIKRDNPELKDYFTFYMSDSQYVINSLTKFIYVWKKQGMDKIWKSSSGDLVKYQSLFKHVQSEYLDNNDWFKTNSFLHIKGHLDKASESKRKIQYGKFIKFNKTQLNYKKKFLTLESFYTLINYNTRVDEIADEARIKHIFYNEERLSEKWEIKTRNVPIRKNRIVVRSRNGNKY